MADGILPLNGVAIPGGQNEDVEDLVGAGGAAVIRQRVQVTGAILTEVARVQDTAPTGAEMALVTRNISERTPNAPSFSRVAASAVSVSLLAANPARKKACFQVDYSGTGKLYLKLGAVASLIDMTAILAPGGYYEVPDPVVTGPIDGIWDVATGAVNITEIT
jgi:hypothetical protein